MTRILVFEEKMKDYVYEGFGVCTPKRHMYFKKSRLDDSYSHKSKLNKQAEQNAHRNRNHNL